MNVETRLFGSNKLALAIDEDGFHRMDYAKLVVPLIKAVQELSAKVDQLESQLNVDGVEASPDS